ncbi:MAG: T9SS type A sorting domain-containing protein [Cyclonatronaceae bacterium]
MAYLKAIKFFVVFTFYMPFHVFAQIDLDETFCGVLDSGVELKGENILSSTPGVVKRFPIKTEGNIESINALIIFVQHKEDNYEDCKKFMGYDSNGVPLYEGAAYTNCANRPVMGYTDCLYDEGGGADPRFADSFITGEYQSWTDDPLTEWPIWLPAGPDVNRTKVLPCWANSIIDQPGTSTITDGSITDLYNQMSNGKFNLRGHVWPYTYIPEHNESYYIGNAVSYGFKNGLTMLSHEIISYVDQNPYSVPTDSTIWDQYTNGNGELFIPDGFFDMIVISFRRNSLSKLSHNHPKGSALASLGHHSWTAGTHGFANDLTLFGLKIKDNYIDGSGVLANQYTKKSLQKVIAHEIGHRQFGGYHAFEPPHINNEYQDNFSIMSNWAAQTIFSAPDRIKLGWANVLEMDVNDISNEYIFYELNDVNNINSANEYDVLHIKNGSNKGIGDLIIEARKRTSYIDKPPGLGNDDGDLSDYFLSVEGLYIYKFPGVSNHLYSSMPNGGTTIRRLFHGINDHQGYGQGDEYSPFTIAHFEFHSSPLDNKLALTNIEETPNGFKFRVWKDYLKTASERPLSSYFTFSSQSVAGDSTWIMQGGKLSINGNITASNVEFKSLSGQSWGGFRIPYGNIDFTLSNSSLLNINSFTGSGAIVINSYGNVRIEHSFLENLNPYYGFGVYVWGSNANPQIYKSTISSTSGPATYTSGSSYLSIRDSELILNGSSNYGIVYASSGSLTAFWFHTYLYDGLNKLIGGSYGIDATGLTTVVRAGTQYTFRYNHFCDQGSSNIRVSNGATANIRFNYWPTSNGPNIINNGGYVETGNNLGISSCSGLLSTMYSDPVVPENTHSNEHIADIYNLLYTIEHGDEMAARLALNDVLLLEKSGIIKVDTGELIRLKETRPNLELDIRLTVAKLFAIRGSHNLAIDILNDLYRSETVTNAEKDQIAIYMSQLFLEQEDYKQAASIFNEVSSRLNKIDYYPMQYLLGDNSAEKNLKPSENQDLLLSEDGDSDPIIFLKNYPNPFNPVTQIRYGLTEPAHVVIQIYTVLGQLVQVIDQGFRETGNHQLNFDAGRLSSGIYIYTMTANGTSISTQKMNILK